MNRSSIAIKSGILGLSSQVLTIVINFVIRTSFIKYLGVEILGIDGVIRELISMLSLADLGISSAMVYRLYKAVIDEDEDKISDLMVIYKQVYEVIALAVFVIGGLLSLFLNFFISDIQTSWKFIYIAYYLQLISTVSTYLLAYKRSILNADQKNYISILIDTSMMIVFSIAKIYFLVAMESYILFLIFTIIQNILSNILVRMYCNKNYPYLSQNKPINKGLRRHLLSDTKDVFAGKIAGYIYSSTDNIIISIFNSTILVGYLSNYTYIFAAIKGLMNSITTPIQSLIGNYLNSIDNKRQTFKTLNYYTHIRYLICILFVIPTMALSNLFIEMWAGNSYVLPSSVVLLLAIDFYISSVYGPLGEYIIGMGMFRYEKFITGIGSGINILFSLVGVYYFGFQGVLFATVLSQMFLWAGKGIIVFSVYFKEYKIFKFQYWKKQAFYIVVVISMFIISDYFSSMINIDNIYAEFIVKGIVIEAIVIVMYLGIYRNCEEYKYFLDIVKNRFFKIR